MNLLNDKNLWAPWRIKYVQGLSSPGGCFICDYLKSPQNDKENLVLWRTEKAVVVLNRFPYNNGHLLIAPIRHIPDLEQADDDELLEMTRLIRETQKALSLSIKPHGFNIGMNFGRCAGAGLPEHMHIHIVPRWNGDTNFMSVCSETKVISQSLNELFEQLKKVSRENNLPSL
jgi:ATP adenylyltransferase